MGAVVVVGGLPGTGKSTVSTALARRTGATYLRVDRIEQAVVSWTSLIHPVGPVGYAIAHSLAAEQLTLGLDVIVECVNPSALTRDPWLATAADAGAELIEVELWCSDTAEHRRRVADRITDVVGLVKPTWSAIDDRDYAPWTRPRLGIDTATTSVDEAVRLIAARLTGGGARPGPGRPDVIGFCR